MTWMHTDISSGWNCTLHTHKGEFEQIIIFLLKPNSRTLVIWLCWLPDLLEENGTQNRPNFKLWRECRRRTSSSKNCKCRTYIKTQNFKKFWGKSMIISRFIVKTINTYIFITCFFHTYIIHLELQYNTT